MFIKMSQGSYELRQGFGILRSISTFCILISFIPLFFPQLSHIVTKEEIEVAVPAWYLVSVGIVLTMLVLFNVKTLVGLLGVKGVQYFVLPAQLLLSVCLVYYIMHQNEPHPLLGVIAWVGTLTISICLTLTLSEKDIKEISSRYNLDTASVELPEFDKSSANLSSFEKAAKTLFFLECTARSLSFTYLIFLFVLPDIHNFNHWNRSERVDELTLLLWGSMYLAGTSLIRFLSLIPNFTRYIESSNSYGLPMLNFVLGIIVFKDLVFYLACNVYSNHEVIVGKAAEVMGNAVGTS
ncbi:hypothetical protein BABINDRAFT_5181 [Babjeviella inositovora NRRL Y-12698]|uniref:Uncharacterized protein n=1 Tax=Babjeviella inositovora NRRL Y-12698 TaxID=984486 RepID=A0A1E3QYL2_9ASCO|nr:uncharacterized protein BABINDRAFT_5181 [Babjeviella inositovora NRRL Y-12698]ODQ82177.1 hypothetical protein BABINDRAFT_5181 [Babjeviella inositovora NRRL Y-12698]